MRTWTIPQQPSALGAAYSKLLRHATIAASITQHVACAIAALSPRPVATVRPLQRLVQRHRLGHDTTAQKILNDMMCAVQALLPLLRRQFLKALPSASWASTPHGIPRHTLDA